GDTGDHLLNQHRLTDSGTAEQPDFASLYVGSQKIDDLNPGLEHLGFRFELVEGRRIAVNPPVLLSRELFALVEVQALAHRIEYAAQRFIADRNLNGFAGVDDFAAAYDTVGRTQANGTHQPVA